MTQDCIAVINAGSSSIKFSIHRLPDLALAFKGRIENLYRGATRFIAQDASGATVGEQAWPDALDHHAGMAFLIDFAGRALDGYRVRAVGHRIVHGGVHYSGPQRLDQAVLAQLERLVPLAPLHLPHNLAPVRALTSLAPGLMQVGCFDTAFHTAQPALAQAFALPPEITDLGIRRYGFHGLSYEYIAATLPQHDPALAGARVVAAHLGNGASMCAMRGGRSVASTMGFTAVDGLPMGTRCGSIDPGVTLFMMRELGMSADEIDHVLSHESGFKGLSGMTSDMQTLAGSDSEAARFTMDYFVMMTAQHAARMAVALGGIDALVFTGGIGEHHAGIRERVVAHLAFLPPFEVRVVEANEERMIAAHCLTLL